MKNFSIPATVSRRCIFYIAIMFSLIPMGGYGIGCRAPDAAHRATKAALRVGTSGDYAPFSETRPTGPAGFSIELARAYARETGRSIEWVPFSWPSLADDLANGRFDLVLSGITIRPERSVEGRFGLPLTTSGAIALVEPGHPAHTADDLTRPGLAVAVNAGGHLERTARGLWPEARVTAVANNHEVLERLGTDGIEAVLTDTLELNVWLERRPELRTIGPLTSDRKAAWVPIGGELEVRRFDRWTLEAERSGRLAGWRERFGLPNTPTAAPVPALLASLDERLSLMIPVARAKQILARPIEDRARESKVLDAAVRSVQSEAERGHVAPPPTPDLLRLYRAQIEAAKWIQQQAMRPSMPLTTAAQRDEARSALEDRLRPALIFLGDRIAGLLVVATADGAPAPSRDAVARALARHALPEEHLRALHEALHDVLRGPRSAQPRSTTRDRAPTSTGSARQSAQRVKAKGAPRIGISQAKRRWTASRLQEARKVITAA
jgi:cyclohexadienyl dehydratase